MRFQREGSIMRVDVHGMSAQGAEDLLLTWLSHAPESISELRVVHGCNRGTAIREMVRTQLHHTRIQSILPALNPGETRLVLGKARNR